MFELDRILKEETKVEKDNRSAQEIRSDSGVGDSDSCHRDWLCL